MLTPAEARALATSLLMLADTAQVWSLLFLPQGVRQSWEQQFPDLRLAA